MKWLKAYVVNLLLSVDQMANAMLFGSPDETISSRLGRLKKACNGNIPWTYPICKCVDFVLDCIDRNHYLEAIETDKPEREILDLTKLRKGGDTNAEAKQNAEKSK